MDEMRNPTTDTPFSIRKFAGSVQALHRGHLIADSDAAILVKDGPAEVFFFPMKDVEMEQMSETDYSTQHPHFGRARYWTLSRDGKIWENGVWSYAEPAPGAEDLQGMVAFRPDVVEIHLVEPERDEMAREQEKMGESIRHTDSGSGLSQEQPWQSNVTMPRE